MVIGYTLSKHDNNSQVLPTKAPSFKCDRCGTKRIRPNPLPDFRLYKKTLDLSATLDGFDIASARFKTFCEAHRCAGVEFTSIPCLPKFFNMTVTPIVEFDTVKRGTEFEDYCTECGNYESVIGATPVALKNVIAPLTEGFFRTDVEFASGHEKSPVLIVGVHTYELLKPERFKGVYFKPIVT